MEHLEENNLEALQEADQFVQQRHQRKVFVGYKEGKINFIRPYKYDPGTDNFDTSTKQRIPSYTDRIVFKHNSNSAVRPLHYDSVQGETCQVNSEVLRFV